MEKAKYTEYKMSRDTGTPHFARRRDTPIHRDTVPYPGLKEVATRVN